MVICASVDAEASANVRAARDAITENPITILMTVMTSMLNILDPKFRYVPADKTTPAYLLAKFRRMQREIEQAKSNVRQIKKAKEK